MCFLAYTIQGISQKDVDLLDFMFFQNITISPKSYGLSSFPYPNENNMVVEHSTTSWDAASRSLHVPPLRCSARIKALTTKILQNVLNVSHVD